ncbi:PREDICTED: MYCBP-associated protein-like [Branchiostoma belcheri]|uniref:MYCBP-associated protein-like n=1 Tax=Branchiostoma belcheri TaxID=7741 RepID=A0A6P4ZHM1_BRABE|nr:PREDICTED: MYCBP-associated protein-like [Branchiostoma belcheri]
MSSKLAVRPSKKDRPKSSGRRKNRDGTPDKLNGSPNQSNTAMEDEEGPAKNVINGEDIQALQIREEDLTKIRVPKPPPETERTARSNRIMVKRLRGPDDPARIKFRQITIARPAPYDAPIKPTDYMGAGGPGLDMTGDILAHTILGSVDDFKQEAIARGEEDEVLPPGINLDMTTATSPSIKYEKKKKQRRARKPADDESNALRNWENKMRERKRQQGFISKLLQRSTDTLLMNQSETYRQTQEERYLIDRTMPAINYGKGYRVGSEFWKQHERLGDDLSGLNMTLTQTERGYPPPFEHVGKPNFVKRETGMQGLPTKSTASFQWERSGYLKTRQKQLQPFMEELVPARPDLDNLEIIGTNKGVLTAIDDEEDLDEFDVPGDHKENIRPMETADTTNDPLAAYPDRFEEPIVGPAMIVGGHYALWTGDDHSEKGGVGISCRIAFEANTAQRKLQFLELTNNGTTAVYYNWRKIPIKNAFDCKPLDTVQRFYFNTNSGVILPGDSMKYPFVFKSQNAGIFTELWELHTSPVLCGGAAIQITLRGVAIQDDVNKESRVRLEQELAHKEAVLGVTDILHSILEGVRTPERARSPLDAYITEEEIFLRKNEGVKWNFEAVQKVQELYKELYPEEEREAQQWDLSLENLKKQLLAIEEDEQREEFLKRMNDIVMEMSVPLSAPVQHVMRQVTYELLQDTIDNMAGAAAVICGVLGMPELHTEPVHVEPIHKIVHKKPEKEKEPDKKDAKKDKGKDDKKGGKKDKEERPKSKGGKGKDKPAATPKKETPAAHEKVEPPKEKEPPVPSVYDSVDPELRQKWREKMYAQTYNLLEKMFDKMTMVYEDIQETEAKDETPIVF